MKAVKSTSQIRKTEVSSVQMRVLGNEVRGLLFMSKGTQSARTVRLGRRAGGLAVSILALIVLGTVGPAMAQEGGNQAGLMIQFGDGSVYTACVELGSDGQATGEEVLRAAGFETRIDFSSGFGGGTVCKIGNEGCNFPADKCFCQCTMKPGDPCIYWSYFHLLEGQWRYSSQGLDSYVVRAGEVEGWVWGASTVGSGAPPPLVTFEQICSAPAPTTEPPQPTATQPPQPTPTATIGEPTGTPRPTNTPAPTASSAPTTPPAPTRTPISETTTPSPRPAMVATDTLLPSATALVTPTRTAAPTATPTAMQTAMQTSVPEAVASDTGSEQIPAAATEIPAPAPTVTEMENGSSASSYIVFGVLVVGLVAGLVLLRIRQKR